MFVFVHTRFCFAEFEFLTSTRREARTYLHKTDGTAHFVNGEIPAGTVYHSTAAPLRLEAQ